MLSSGLRSWQQENNFRVSGDTVYGVFENVGFSATEEDGGRLFIFMLSGKDEAFDRLEDMLCSQSGALRNAQVGDVENYLAVFFDDADGRLSSAEMSDLLDFVVCNFRSCGFRTPNVCVKCGAPATKRAFYNDMVQPLCAPCRESDKLEKAHKAAAPAAADRASDYDRAPSRGYDEPRRNAYDRDDYDDRRQPRRGYDEHSFDDRRYAADPNAWGDSDRDALPSGEGNAPAGFFGALLGAVAGLAPFIVSVLLGFSLPALCFISGICAVMGYVAFGGQRTKTNALVTVIALSVIVSLAMVLVFAGAASGFSVLMGNIIELAGLNLLMAGIGALLGVAVKLDSLHGYLS